LLFAYMMFETKTAIFTMNALFSDNLSERQKHLIRSIFLKHGHDKDSSMSYVDMLSDFMNNSTYETGDICIGFDVEMFLNKFSPTLDAKIKELEAQIS